MEQKINSLQSFFTIKNTRIQNFKYKKLWILSLGCPPKDKFHISTQKKIQFNFV